MPSSRRLLLGAAVFLSLPAPVLAAEHAHLDLPVWSVAAFVLLLLSIAILPLVLERWWHKNRNKGLVAFCFALPVVVYLLILDAPTRGASTHKLLHAVKDYVQFIILLGSLYTVSGGIVLRGDIEGRPLTNGFFLALGAVLVAGSGLAQRLGQPVGRGLAHRVQPLVEGVHVELLLAQLVVLIWMVLIWTVLIWMVTVWMVTLAQFALPAGRTTTRRPGA